MKPCTLTATSSLYWHRWDSWLHNIFSVQVSWGLYWSVYAPILIYGHELWVETERTRSRIQAAEMRFTDIGTCPLSFNRATLRLKLLSHLPPLRQPHPQHHSAQRRPPWTVSRKSFVWFLYREPLGALSLALKLWIENSGISLASITETCQFRKIRPYITIKFLCSLEVVIWAIWKVLKSLKFSGHGSFVKLQTVAFQKFLVSGWILEHPPHCTDCSRAIKI